MILRLALRSLAMRPMRTAVLAIGFGLGIAVMAELVGVGEVILEQAHSPALAGGGDLVVSGGYGSLESARFVLAHVLGADRLRARVRVASPARKATLYLLRKNGAIAVAVRAGIPDRERAIGDPEIADHREWRNTARDDAWVAPTPGELVRAMDRFHPVPPRRAASRFGPASWAEWLYFNGRSPDGALRFYLTFLAPGGEPAEARPVIVRLQLNRRGVTTNDTAATSVDEPALLARAPDIDVGGSRVRVGSDGAYRITLALPRVTGEIVLTPAAGRSLPPVEIHGAGGWLSGYVVPVLAGTFAGTLRVDGQDVRVDGAAGYHDHNWGYWDGVQWQWGQVAGGGVSIVYGRVFPPDDVADRARMPGFLGVLGPDGPVGFSTNVTITESDRDGAPGAITVESRDRRLPMTLRFAPSEVVRTPFALTRGPGGTMTFLQLGGEYRVTGHAGDRDLDFTARGSAETFR
jgi:hypothetical protein